MDYESNSREAIRKYTLDRFEQARVVDRNRDDPTRATNSKEQVLLSRSVAELLRHYLLAGSADTIQIAPAIILIVIARIVVLKKKDKTP